MTRLIIVRHGESNANKTRTFAGHLNIPLSERGEMQAKMTAEYIVQRYQIDKIYCSDLLRAYHTALPIANITGAPLIKTEKLREIYAGDWEGKTFNELQTRYADTYGVWLCDIGNARPNSGEAVQELYERVYNALQEIVFENDGKTIAVATHATPIRALQCRFSGFSVNEMKNVPWVTNDSVTVVDYENGVFSLVSVSEDKHLESLATGFPANV